jgi:hypothetical protein
MSELRPWETLFYSNIAHACFIIAVDNGGIHRDRGAEAWQRDYEHFIERQNALLSEIDAWLGTAAIRALEAAGFAIVPTGPTLRMIEATYDLDIYWHYQSDGRPGAPEDAYCAMLAAAREEK